jgi:hypothetical protein
MAIVGNRAWKIRHRRVVNRSQGYKLELRHQFRLCCTEWYRLKSRRPLRDRFPFAQQLWLV